MALLCRVALVVLCVYQSARATTGPELDYGGVPLWINRLLGEPSVLSLQGRMDSAWYKANNPVDCPERCDCPIHWPTAVYCDHRALEDIPDRLPDATQYLFLQGNNISSLPLSVHGNITGLRWLILDQNQLQSHKLDQSALQKQTRLRYLFANQNHLTTVPSGLPPGLRELRLAHNHINRLKPGTFQHLRNLTVLLLQGNRLKTITQGVFTGLVSLNLLDLSGNHFSSVPSHLPPSIQQLYLSDNSLTNVAEDSFTGILGLQYLRMSRCGLRSPKLRPQVFNHSRLTELDLSYNKLTHIPTVPTTLQYLYLEANQIHEFNVTSFCREIGPLSYSRMRILRLDGNGLAYHQLPPEWVYCLRVLHNIYI